MIEILSHSSTVNITIFRVKKRFGADDFSLAFARIENHYFTNKVLLCTYLLHINHRILLIHLLFILYYSVVFHFLTQGFFPRDGWLIEKANIDKIRHIPTFIVQGRYDMVTKYTIIFLICYLLIHCLTL